VLVERHAIDVGDGHDAAMAADVAPVLGRDIGGVSQ
jgi:hypothetical protein